MGCMRSVPARALAYDKPTFVVAVGSGAMGVYLNGAKISAADYYHDEYERFAAADGWDIEPLLTLISQKIMSVIRAVKRNALQAHTKTDRQMTPLDELTDQLNLEGKRQFAIKVGITGAARSKLRADQLRERIQAIHTRMEHMSNWHNMAIGVLSHELESVLEQRSAWTILDSRYPGKECVIFNMGSIDCRVFTKQFELLFRDKGAKFAPKADYNPTLFSEQTESKFEHFEARRLKPRAVLLAFCGFFGYLFSMPHFKLLWKAILKGKPIPLAKVKQALEALVEMCKEANEGNTLDKNTKMLLMMNKRELRGTSDSEVYRTSQHLGAVALSFVTSTEAKVRNIGGVIIDNKLGAHVKKVVSPEYKDVFNRAFSSELHLSYGELNKDGTFGTEQTFTWAIPLGLSDDLEVPGSATGTSGFWKEVRLHTRQRGLESIPVIERRKIGLKGILSTSDESNLLKNPMSSMTIEDGIQSIRGIRKKRSQFVSQRSETLALDDWTAGKVRRGTWTRNCFTQKNKDSRTLLDVATASRRRLEQLSAARRGSIALTSFRKGGPNEEHQMLHFVDSELQKIGASYVHYQSGHENTLFGFGPSEASFAFKTSSGPRACKTEEATTEYQALQLRTNWYIEWLQILHWLVVHGGTLVLFDLSGPAAMNTSPNCAMEICLLYQIFEGSKMLSMRDQIRLVVIVDDDCNALSDQRREFDGNVLREKLRDQPAQQHLFRLAYEKCGGMLKDADATTILYRWITDFEFLEEGLELDYLRSAFFGLLTNKQLAAWCDDKTNQRCTTALKIQHNEQLTALPRECGNLTKLEALTMSSCPNVTELTPSISSLQSLRELKLYENEKLGDEAAKLVCTSLTGLKVLEMQVVGLTQLPVEIGALGQLEILNVSENKLQALPDSIGLLTNLKQLHLLQNRLSPPLPDSISKLTNLEHLALMGNAKFTDGECSDPGCSKPYCICFREHLEKAIPKLVGGILLDAPSRAFFASQ